MNRFRRIWPALQGVLVLLHVVAVVVLAVPSLRAGLDRSSWKDPTVQREFRAWAERLGMRPADLEEKAWRFATGWSRTRERMVVPFGPYSEWLGIRQPWVMFVAPHRYPTRLEIEVEEGGTFRTVYRERSPEHGWKRELFDHDRMRSAVFRYGWDRYGAAYRELCRWLAKEAARDFPDATRMRVRMFRRRTPSPEEVVAGRAPPGRYEREIVLELP